MNILIRGSERSSIAFIFWQIQPQSNYNKMDLYKKKSVYDVMQIETIQIGFQKLNIKALDSGGFPVILNGDRSPS